MPPDHTASNKVAEADDCDTVCTLTKSVSLDMTDYSDEFLSFYRYVDRSLDLNEYLILEIYDGSNWIELDKWNQENSDDDDAWHLENYSLSEIGDSLSKNGFDKKLITKIAFGDSKFQYMNEIVSGTLGADMMDYLLRDGYFTGAEHAKIDHKRITQSLDVHQKKLVLERSALYSFESMMYSCNI